MVLQRASGGAIGITLFTGIELQTLVRVLPGVRKSRASASVVWEDSIEIDVPPSNVIS